MCRLRRETAVALRRQHVKVHVVNEGIGGDFGEATMVALGNCAAMAAFCFENYGEKTQVPRPRARSPSNLSHPQSP